MRGLSAAWWDRLQTVRWFGGKGAAGRVAGLTPLPWYTPPGAWPAVRSEIAELAYDDGRAEHYQLLVAYRPADQAAPDALGTAELPGLGRVAAHDATADAEATRAFVAACRRGASGMSWAHPLGDAELPVKVWAGEQSNTTIVLGDLALFKLFRKVEPGPNLDAEVLTALDGSDADTPALFGRLEGAWPEGTTTDLGMVIERVRDAHDGWELASAACADDVDFTLQAGALGRSLRQVHDQLAATFGTTEREGDAIAATMADRLAAATRQAPMLDEHAGALASAFGALRGQRVAVQRVHGDFHLGQTLASPAGWTIIDFEGEPAKTASERREPDSVWRDVAGMLRSFDYARSAHAEPGSAAATMWAERARDGFLTGYCDATDVRWDLLAAYEVDKAVYEVVYEVRNRPGWVDIPMRAIREQGRRSGDAGPETKE